MIQPRDEEVRHKCAVLRSAGVRGFLGGPVVKSLPCSAGDTGSILDLGRSHMLQSSQASVPQLLALRAEMREAATMRSLHTATRAQPPTLCNQRKPACGSKGPVPPKIARYINKI